MLIKCPNCGESITLEQNVYDSIANEIRNEQFEKELEKRATSLIKEKESEIALAVSQAEGRKEKEISELKAKIASVEAKLKTAEVERAAKLTELATKKDAELSVKLAEAEKTISNLKVKNESLENALRRFKKQCARAGVIAEVRKREAYEKPSVKRKKKSEAARKRKFR